MANNITISPYEVLELPEGATIKDIKRQYKRLIRIHTPESSSEKFMTIRGAYDALYNAEMRHHTFPFYQKPMAFFKEVKQNAKTAVIETPILTKVFESPFNTIYELQQLIKKEK